MDESAQQAVSIGVNVTIFIVALTVTLSLMFGVRDIADVAGKVDKNIPDGSMVLATKDLDSRIISGYEVISYYYNYIKPYFKDESGNKEYNHKNIGIVIKTEDDVFRKEFIAGNVDNITTENDALSYNSLKSKIDLNANYTLSIKEHYKNTNTESGTTIIYIEQIPELVKGAIYNYYITNVKPIFVNPDTNTLYESCGLKIKLKYSDKDETIPINVNNDVENSDEKVKDVLNELEASREYSVRIKRENVKKDMTSSSIILYIE